MLIHMPTVYQYRLPELLSRLDVFSVLLVEQFGYPYKVKRQPKCLEGFRTRIGPLERVIKKLSATKLAGMLQVAPSEIVKRTEALLAQERKPARKRTPIPAKGDGGSQPR
jgi:hypothetical protein